MIWAFDLDGTLIGSIRSDQLRPGATELLDGLSKRGIDCVLWSAGGAEYARSKAREHGIEDRFIAFYAKALRDASARYLVDHFADVHRPDVFVDDSPIDMPVGARVVSVPQFIGGNGADRALFGVLEQLSARGAVIDRLAELFTQWPAEQALQLAGGDERRWWTWGDVARLHRALSAVLSARGVTDDAAIAIVMAQQATMAAAELAVIAGGRTALLVSPLQADRALAEELTSLRAAVVVANMTDWARTGVAESVAASGALGLAVDDDFDVDVRADVDLIQEGPRIDAAVTVLTSGTTGPAKRMPVSWEAFVQLGGGPDGRTPKSNKGALILSLPLVTLGGLLSMARLVFMGRPMSMMERFDVHTWASLVKEHRPNVMGAPPAVVKMILDADISPDHFEGVTAYLTSSAPIAPEVATAFEDRYGIPVLLGYGATEFLSSVTGWTAELWSEFGTTKLGSVGRAHPGVRLRVMEPDTGQEVAPGEDGILEVDPPLRTGNLAEGWLRTTDRARIDADGFLWILGRADDVILRGGFKVNLDHVEAALLEHSAVAAACVVGLDDERLGQVPAAVVVKLDDSRGDPTEAELIAWARDLLPPYSVPVMIQFVEAIPRTTTLKVHRAAVQQLFTD